jgi:hypothetical protein
MPVLESDRQACQGPLARWPTQPGWQQLAGEGGCFSLCCIMHFAVPVWVCVWGASQLRGWPSQRPLFPPLFAPLVLVRAVSLLLILLFFAGSFKCALYSVGPIVGLAWRRSRGPPTGSASAPSSRSQSPLFCLCVGSGWPVLAAR